MGNALDKLTDTQWSMLRLSTIRGCGGHKGGFGVPLGCGGSHRGHKGVAGGAGRTLGQLCSLKLASPEHERAIWEMPCPVTSLHLRSSTDLQWRHFDFSQIYEKHKSQNRSSHKCLIAKAK